MSRQPTAHAGKKLGRYRIERELGRGGMGVVYLAEDENTGRRIALKTTSVAGLGGGQTSRNQRRQRFVREVQALTQVNHDNVVHVIDAGEADDADLGWLLFYSMEYVEGETLAQLVQRKGALEPGAAAAVCEQVAAGLGAAHRAGIVHRDVKPANIFISLDGRALIGDFGICKIEGQTQITRRDQLVGTPNYLAPEQILGDAVGAPTDVFALGALYYVITMNRPLRSHVDAAALLASAQGNEPRDRMMSERSVPDALRRVVARCLERDPKKRWSDGQALADALAEHATRIPSLRDETVHDALNTTSTSDRSSPFQSLPSAPSEDAIEAPQFGDPAAVAAAAALLERGLDARGPKEEAERALPVARTESTVMFNLRAMEEEEHEKKPLPVAKTESTVMYKMQEGDDDRASSSRLDTTSMGMADDPTPVGSETSDEEIRPQPRVRSFDVDASRGRRSIKLNLPNLPRPAWIGISGAGGALIGIIMVAIMAPASHSTEKAPATAAPDAIVPLSDRARPSMCSESNDARSVNTQEEAKAKKLYDDALNAFNRAEQATVIREQLVKSIQYDPHSVDAFFLLGKVYGKTGESKLQNEAYLCVCKIAEASEACHHVAQFIK